MKRLVWLLVAIFGTALAQVSPVDLALTKPAACSCCERPGACGMPDCVPPAAPAARTTINLSCPAVAIRVAAKPARAAREAREIFTASCLSRAAGARALTVLVNDTMPRRLPLYQAHCSLLI